MLASQDGKSVERDFEKCTVAMYTNYHTAMRDDITVDNPGQSLIFADATGGWRGSSVTHVTAGSGDWKANKALSKLSLDPVGMGEGKDVNAVMHAMLGKRMAPSVKRVVNKGNITIAIANATGAQENKVVPMQVFFCADFQARCCVD